MKKYFLEIIVFICGAAVMVFELVGSRILAPYLGTSLIVWTSLIGIILGALSIGYWQGGKIADEHPNFRILSYVVFASAVLVALAAFSNAFVLNFITSYFLNSYLRIISAVAALFFLPSMLLGMVSPYAIRLKMNNISDSGKTAGNLYALSTIGSIAGTFFAGFFLIPFFGSVKILYVLSACLFIASLFSSIAELKSKLIIAAILAPVVTFYSARSAASKDYIDTDTQYSRVIIKEKFDWNLLRPTLNLITDPCGVQSAMYSDIDDELVSKYLKYYRLAKYFTYVDKTLMIGGGGFSYPKDYLKEYPNAQMDVIELDPKIVELAENYFNLKKDPRLFIYNEDARVFLNETKNKYDAIFMDAFTSNLAIPYQLTTQEAVKKMHSALNDKGVIIVNIVSSIEGDKGKFLRAEYATYKSVFNQVYLFPVSFADNGEKLQNVILIAAKSDKKIDFSFVEDFEAKELFSHLWKKDVNIGDVALLTDDYAPVDYYTKNLCK